MKNAISKENYICTLKKEPAVDYNSDYCAVSQKF